MSVGLCEGDLGMGLITVVLWSGEWWILWFVGAEIRWVGCTVLCSNGGAWETGGRSCMTVGWREDAGLRIRWSYILSSRHL